MPRRRPRGGKRRQGIRGQGTGDRRSSIRRPSIPGPHSPTPIPNPSAPTSHTELPPHAFVNASEEEFAHILDFYRVK
ncbi:MAG TPA: hypothetical protein VHS06_00690, partial [Chloroflexota bacterium]|nr:hypothetical protein [Chloroflexota bacterium]